jgi:hypothetical protein
MHRHHVALTRRPVAAFRRWIMQAAASPAARGKMQTKTEAKIKSGKKDPIM